MIAEAKGISIAELERKCGFSCGYVGHIRKGMSLKYRTAVIQNFPDINLEWLTNGSGYMFNSHRIEQPEREAYKKMIQSRDNRIRELEEDILSLISIIEAME